MEGCDNSWRCFYFCTIDHSMFLRKFTLFFARFLHNNISVCNVKKKNNSSSNWKQDQMPTVKAFKHYSSRVIFSLFSEKEILIFAAIKHSDQLRNKLERKSKNSCTLFTRYNQWEVWKSCWEDKNCNRSSGKYKMP